MNKQSNQLRATILMVASTLLFVACGSRTTLEARTPVPGTFDTKQSAPDPALNNLEAVTHHG